MKQKWLGHRRLHCRPIIAQLQLALALAISVLMLSSVSVQAALTYSKRQTDDGLRFVLVTGVFENSDNLQEFSRAVIAHQPHFVSFNSPGGIVGKAMELGRLIRSLGLNTLQVRANECASACSLAFFGGVKRLADPGSIGVHKLSLSGDSKLDTDAAVSGIQEAMHETITYLLEMGIDTALLAVQLKIESNDVQYLTLSDMVKYRVITTQEPQHLREVQTPPAKEPEPDLAAIPPDQSEGTPKPQQPTPSPQVSTPAPQRETTVDLSGQWDLQTKCAKESNNKLFEIKNTSNNVYLGNVYLGSEPTNLSRIGRTRIEITGNTVEIYIYTTRNTIRIEGILLGEGLIQGQDSSNCTIMARRRTPTKPSPSPQVSTPVPPPVSHPPVPQEQEINLTGRWDYQANCGQRGRITGTFDIGQVSKTTYRGSGRNSRGATATVQFTLTQRTIKMTLDWSDGSQTQFNGVVKEDNVIVGRDSVGCNVNAYRSVFRSLVSEIQTELNRLGCDAGIVDGIWGEKSEAALRQFLETMGVNISPEPTSEILEQLKSPSSRRCVLPKTTNRQGIPARASTEKIRHGWVCTKPGAQTYWFKWWQDGVHDLTLQGYGCWNTQ